MEWFFFLRRSWIKFCILFECPSQDLILIWTEFQLRFDVKLKIEIKLDVWILGINSLTYSNKNILCIGIYALRLHPNDFSSCHRIFSRDAIWFRGQKSVNLLQLNWSRLGLGVGCEVVWHSHFVRNSWMVHHDVGM